MALTSRIALAGGGDSEPEDFFASSLGVIFTDDVTNQHGDADHSLVYTSPRLPRPLLIDLADPVGDEDRSLFSHFLWNSSLLLAELVERDTPGPGLGAGAATAPPVDSVPGGRPGSLGHGISFDVAGKHLLELGAGTALPSIMAGLLGAARVVVTDYPAPAVMDVLRANVARGIRPELSPSGAATTTEVLVEGHEWGVFAPKDADVGGGFSAANQHAFDRLLVADCLWMPWQHANLLRSLDFFMRRDARARCWVVAGFHTGRPKMRGFFAPDALGGAGLAIDRIWERDCNGEERPWDWERDDDITLRKRWLVVAVLKRAAVS